MNIVLGQDRAAELTDRYVVLTLDTFRISERPDPVTSYCLLENVPIQDMADIERWRDLHETMMQQYARRNWSFCQQALEHLMGRWNRELDSFYLDLSARVNQNLSQDPGPEWSYIINR